MPYRPHGLRTSHGVLPFVRVFFVPALESFFFGPEEGSESLFYLAFRAKFFYCIEDKECRNKGIGRLTS